MDNFSTCPQGVGSGGDISLCSVTHTLEWCKVNPTNTGFLLHTPVALVQRLEQPGRINSSSRKEVGGGRGGAGRAWSPARVAEQTNISPHSEQPDSGLE